MRTAAAVARAITGLVVLAAGALALSCGLLADPVPTIDDVVGAYVLTHVNGAPLPAAWAEGADAVDSLYTGTLALHTSGLFHVTYQGLRHFSDTRYTERLLVGHGGRFEIGREGRITFDEEPYGAQSYHGRHRRGRIVIEAPARRNRLASVTLGYSPVDPALELSPDSVHIGAIHGTGRVGYELTARDTQEITVLDEMLELGIGKAGVVEWSTPTRLYSVGEGVTSITVAAFGAADTSVVVVRQWPASLRVEPPALAAPVGAVAPLPVEIRDGRETEIREWPVAWASSDSSVADLDGNVLTLKALGDATVTARVDTLTDTIAVHGVDNQYVGVFVAALHAWGLAADGTAAYWEDWPSTAAGAEYDFSVPDPVSVGIPVEDVVAGYDHACGLYGPGSAVCWNLEDSSTPVEVDATFVEIDAAGNRTCARTDRGRVWCWGHDALADAPNEPTLAADSMQFEQIGVGEAHTCGLDTLGGAWCWGWNEHYRLGTNAVSEGDTTTEPVAVAGGHRFVDLAVGMGQTCALTAGGAVWCWGVGWPDAGEFRPEPTRVAENVAFAKLGRGAFPMCGIDGSGTGYCWPWGDGEPARPVPIAYPLTEITANEFMGCGLTGMGAYCWRWARSPSSPIVAAGVRDDPAQLISLPIP